MWRPVMVWLAHTRSASSGERNPSASLVGRMVRPQAAMEPVSCTLMWASFVQMTPSQSRSMPVTPTMLAEVPPMQNSTSTSSRPHAARFSSRARSQWGSPSV